MGLGGYLTWTAAFHEITAFTGKKVLPIEINEDGSFRRVVYSPIFGNNPNILQPNSMSNLIGDGILHAQIPLNLPATNYCKLDTYEKAVQRHDKHIVLQILDFYGIGKRVEDIQCRYCATIEEATYAQKLLGAVAKNKRVVAFEVFSNKEYTCNKEYPLKHWRYVVERLKEELGDKVELVEIGLKRSGLPFDVTFAGMTTFTECYGILKYADLFVSTEGGLVHLANAADTQSVSLITGYEHPDMVAYPRNTNIWIHGDHGPCGMKVKCEECWKHVNAHDPEQVVQAIKKALCIK